MKVCVIDGHLGLSVCLLNVHKIGAEKRYLTNSRNSYKVFRYLYMSNSLQQMNIIYMKERSLDNLYILRTYKQHIV